MPCAKPDSCSSHNRIFRVPLSVKRTVPPQLSATASLPLPVATVGAFPFTAVPGHSPPHAAALVRTVIANHPRCSCHCEPVTVSLVWQSVPPSPRPQARQPLFTFASGGHLSFNSERKVRKNATKTYGFGFPQRAMRCRKLALCSSRNRIFRVPLSVKRTVPPQLSAVASLPLPVVTVAVSTSTAVTGREL